MKLESPLNARKTFIKWMRKELNMFSIHPGESIGDTMIGLIRFWADESRVALFLSYTTRVDHFQAVYWLQMQELICSGEFGIARLWFATLHISIYVFNLELNDSSKFELLSIVDLIKKNDAKMQRASFEFLHQGSEKTMILYFPYYHMKTNLSLRRWILLIAPKLGRLHGSHVPEVDIPGITLQVMFNEDLTTHQTLFFNPTCTVKAFLLLVTSKVEAKQAQKYTLRRCPFDMTRLPDMIILSPEMLEREIGAIFSHLDTIDLLPHNEPTDQVDSVQIKKSNVNVQKRKKKRCKAKKAATVVQPAKNVPIVTTQRRRSVVQYSVNNNEDRLKHSLQLSRIFEEAADLFQERRQHLNDLALKKASPKQKSPIESKSGSTAPEPVCFCSTENEGKGGKTFFPVLIGHEEYLYKSSKSTKHAHTKPRSLDLHRYTRDEALLELISSLPDWLEAAMKEHPYTLPVNIITGGGSQIVSDAVENWIRENRNVANRFS